MNHFTKEESKALGHLKVTAAQRAADASNFSLRERPWNKEQWINILQRNASFTPIEAVRMVNDGKYQVALAMLRHTVSGLEDLIGLEQGTKEVADEGLVEKQL